MNKKKFQTFFEKKEKIDEVWERRLYFYKIFIFICFFILGIRLFYLQGIKHKYYLQKAKARSVVTYVIKAPRGEIITADGVVVATNRAIFQLYIDLENVKEEEEVLKRLSLILKEDYGILKERYYLAKKTYLGRILLKRNLSWDEVSKILVRQYYLSGVVVEVETERYYPYGPVYFHLIGYVSRISREEYKTLKDYGYSSEDLIGKLGIERIYEKYLKGQNGKIEIERDAYGRLGRIVGKTLPVPGEDVIITVRHDLQIKAYELLKDRSGAIVALSPKDGGLLTWVSSPSIDSNTFVFGFEPEEWKKVSLDPKKPLLNRVIQAYPPGSTYKVITALAGLKSEIVKGLNWGVFCSGAYPYGNHIFHCWERKGHGWVNLIKALALSCDVFFYTIGSKIDIDLLAKESKALGLGELTGIGFPNEKAGLVPDRAWKKGRFKAPWHQGETIVVSIGQGYITATPLQIARVYMAIANGGFLYTPYFVKEIRTKRGKIIFQATPKLERKIEFNPKFLEWIKEGLKEAVESGTGRASYISGIKVWGKTGTAQVVSLQKKTKYLEHHAWFVSFAGNSTPEIVSAILVEHGGGGGAIAAPLANELYRAFYHLPSVRAEELSNNTEEFIENENDTSP